MLNLKPPRHTPTLRIAVAVLSARNVRFLANAARRLGFALRLHSGRGASRGLVQRVRRGARGLFEGGLPAAAHTQLLKAGLGRSPVKPNRTRLVVIDRGLSLASAALGGVRACALWFAPSDTPVASTIDRGVRD